MSGSPEERMRAAIIYLARYPLCGSDIVREIIDGKLVIQEEKLHG